MSGTGQTYALDIVGYMVSAAHADGGGTFEPATGKRANLASGYMVGYGMRGGPALFVPAACAYGPAGRAQVRAVVDAVRLERDRGDRDAYVGAWRDDSGAMVWEVSVRWDMMTDALRIARARGEHSVWDVAGRRAIRVAYPDGAYAAAPYSDVTV